MNKRYLYVGAYINLRTKELLDSYERKIGVTNDLTTRERALNDTKGPIGYFMIQAWDFDGVSTDAYTSEQHLHKLLRDLGYETYGEWVDNSGVEDFVRRHCEFLGSKEVILHATTEVEKVILDKVISSKSRPNVDKLVGQRFSYSREGVEITIEVTPSGEFKDINSDEVFSKPSAPFRKGWTGKIQGARELNGWTSPKNEHGRSIDEELALLGI